MLEFIYHDLNEDRMESLKTSCREEVMKCDHLMEEQSVRDFLGVSDFLNESNFDDVYLFLDEIFIAFA